MSATHIESERLILRSWRDGDLDGFHAVNSDPLVMATLGPLLTRAQTMALIERMRITEARLGHCFWALERKEDAHLIGWCGVIRGSVGPVEGRAEIGWRLARSEWGNGYASEAAAATIGWIGDHLADRTIWAITAQTNLRSRAVMERIGMRQQPALTFDHPALADGNPLRRHVAYTLDSRN